MSKLNFAKNIWWWQFACKDGWTPDYINKLGWELKIKSIHKVEWFKICVGSLISWCKPFCEDTASIFLPSSPVISLLYQFSILGIGLNFASFMAQIFLNSKVNLENFFMWPYSLRVDIKNFYLNQELVFFKLNFFEGPFVAQHF